MTEVTLSAPFTAERPWLVGLFLARTRQDIGLTLATLGPAGVTGFQEVRRDRLNEAAIFGQVELPLGERVRLTVGGRLFASDTEVDSAITAPLAGAAARFTGQIKHSGFTPRWSWPMRSAPAC
uniref:TonB-dependent receptor n=1 Tax=Phenylobacterium glaciei TaxID=2803784 RepID=A0A974SAV0_9CAUL|nr:TonB-dependent receptor [Phenylobacterium glaciei]